MLFEEIEQEVTEKDRVVSLQIEKLREMADSYQTMLDYEQVLINIKAILPQLRGDFNAGVGLASFNEDEPR
jgi:hypothetical protein